MTEAIHPRLLIRAQPTPGLRTVDDLRAAVATGHTRALWVGIQKQVDADVGTEPLTAFADLPERSPEDIRQGNRDFIVVHAAGQRVGRAALAHLLTGNPRYRGVAMAQIACLFDEKAWPEWQDSFHRRVHDLDADLRTGQLCRDLGLAFDWLHDSLSAADREWFVEGLDRRGVQPYLQAVDDRAWWLYSLHNWTTVIVGGLGVCGMALRGYHPEADRLVTESLPLMQRYMDQYGPDGEFNENPAYANASVQPALYFSAYRYYTAQTETPREIAALRRHCYWCAYATAPPGHLVSFGDGGPEYPALVSFFPAVAAATGDPILQWYYQTYGRGQVSKARFPLWELLWYDATLEPRAPTVEDLPLGRAFPAHSGIVSSRTGWDPHAATCVVFGKAGSGAVNHSHPDAGQIEVQAHGQRLIADLGSVPYPGSEHRQYYHFSSEGHNVVTIGDGAMRWDGKHRARLAAWEFDNGRGGWWQVDTTELYEGAGSIRRTVVHLLPAIIAVLDEVKLGRPEVVRVRWHTGGVATLGEAGAFSVEMEGVCLHAQVLALKRDGPGPGIQDGPGPDVPELKTGVHEYRPPYDHDRMGNPLPQRREPYVDARVPGQECRVLTLLSASGPEEEANAWSWAGPDWCVTTAGGVARVSVSAASLTVAWEGTDQRWEVPIA